MSRDRIGRDRIGLLSRFFLWAEMGVSQGRENEAEDLEMTVRIEADHNGGADNDGCHHVSS